MLHFQLCLAICDDGYGLSYTWSPIWSHFWDLCCPVCTERPYFSKCTGYINSYLGERATFDLSALATGSRVVAKSPLPWYGEGITLPRPWQAEARLGMGSGYLARLVRKSWVPVTETRRAAFSFACCLMQSDDVCKPAQFGFE